MSVIVYVVYFAHKYLKKQREFVRTLGDKIKLALLIVPIVILLLLSSQWAIAPHDEQDVMNQSNERISPELGLMLSKGWNYVGTMLNGWSGK